MAVFRRVVPGVTSQRLDSLLQPANDASALVFLVAESEQTYQRGRNVLRALGQAREIIQGADPGAAGDPWADLNALLGRATREFQNSARIELGVSGPIAVWHGPALAGREG